MTKKISLLKRQTNTFMINSDFVQEAMQSFECEKTMEEIRAEAGEVEASSDANVFEKRALQVEDGYAIIPVKGVIYKSMNFWTEYFGITTQEGIMDGIQRAIDAGHDGVILDIDSPGGLAQGNEEVVDFIKAKRSEISIDAYVETMACSAAYWIGSACGQIHSKKDAFIGSIGVLQTHRKQIDTDVMGDMYYSITSSNAPDKRLDPTVGEDKAKIVAELDSLEEFFISSIAANRGKSEEYVKENFGRGGILIATKAKTAGMVDAISDFETALKSISEQTTTEAEEDNMSKFTQEECDAMVATAVEEAKAGVDTKDVEAKAHSAGVAAEQSRITSLEAVAIDGYDDLLAEAKADVTMTAEKLAMKICSQQKAQGSAHIAELAAAEKLAAKVQPKATSEETEEEKEEEKDAPVTHANISDKHHEATVKVMKDQNIKNYKVAMEIAAKEDKQIAAYFKTSK